MTGTEVVTDEPVIPGNAQRPAHWSILSGVLLSVPDDDDLAGHAGVRVVRAHVAERADAPEHHREDERALLLDRGRGRVAADLDVVAGAELDRVALGVLVDPLHPGADKDRPLE